MRHPYTEALLRSIPRVEDPSHTRLRVITGRPPNLLDPPPGCSFSPAVPVRRSDRCREEVPPLELERQPTAIASPASTRSARRRTPRHSSATSPPGCPRRWRCSIGVATASTLSRRSPPSSGATVNTGRQTQASTTARMIGRRRGGDATSRHRANTRQRHAQAKALPLVAAHWVRGGQRAGGPINTSTTTRGNLASKQAPIEADRRHCRSSPLVSPPHAAAMTTTTGPRQRHRGRDRGHRRGTEATARDRQPTAHGGHRGDTEATEATERHRRPPRRQPRATDGSANPTRASRSRAAPWSTASTPTPPTPGRHYRASYATSGYIPLQAVSATRCSPSSDEGETVPLLVETVENNADYTEWTLTIREGIKFHDGTAARRRGRQVQHRHVPLTAR